MSGAFFPFEELEDIFLTKEVVLCEGLATGLTIKEAINKPVVIYFSANNLQKVANHFHKKCTIYVAVDNDTQSSTGRKEFERANKNLGDSMVMLFPPAQGDWNDYYLKTDLKTAKTEIENQIKEKAGYDPIFL